MSKWKRFSGRKIAKTEAEIRQRQEDYDIILKIFDVLCPLLDQNGEPLKLYNMKALFKDIFGDYMESLTKKDLIDNVEELLNYKLFLRRKQFREILEFSDEMFWKYLRLTNNWHILKRSTLQSFENHQKNFTKDVFDFFLMAFGESRANEVKTKLQLCFQEDIAKISESMDLAFKNKHNQETLLDDVDKCTRITSNILSLRERQALERFFDTLLVKSVKKRLFKNRRNFITPEDILLYFYRAKNMDEFNERFSERQELIKTIIPVFKYHIEMLIMK